MNQAPEKCFPFLGSLKKLSEEDKKITAIGEEKLQQVSEKLSNMKNAIKITEQAYQQKTEELMQMAESFDTAINEISLVLTKKKIINEKPEKTNSLSSLKQLKILEQLNFAKLYVCSCSHTDTIFFEEEQYKDHVEEFHRGTSFPYSSHHYYICFRNRCLHKKKLEMNLFMTINYAKLLRKVNQLQAACSKKAKAGWIQQYSGCFNLQPHRQSYVPITHLKRNINFCPLVLISLLEMRSLRQVYKKSSLYCQACRQLIKRSRGTIFGAESLASEHMQHHKTSSVIRFSCIVQQYEREAGKLERGQIELIVCGCKKYIFPSMEQYKQHVESVHHGYSLPYSSHVFIDGIGHKNPSFSQKCVLENLLLPEMYMCGFCYKKEFKRKIFLCEDQYISHMRTYHRPPFNDDHNSHFFNSTLWKQPQGGPMVTKPKIQHQVYLDSDNQSQQQRGKLSSESSFEQPSSQEGEQSEKMVQNENNDLDGTQKIIKNFRYIQKTYTKPFYCAKCKKQFFTVEQFLGHKGKVHLREDFCRYARIQVFNEISDQIQVFIFPVDEKIWLKQHADISVTFQCCHFLKKKTLQFPEFVVHAFSHNHLLRLPRTHFGKKKLK